MEALIEYEKKAEARSAAARKAWATRYRLAFQIQHVSNESIRDVPNEANDCTVKAFARVTGLPYSEVHAFLKAYGRKDRGAFYTSRLLGRGRDCLGHRFELVVTRIDGARPTLRRFIARHPAGVYLVRISGHLLAIRDGVLFDDLISHFCHVKTAWLVTAAATA